MATKTTDWRPGPTVCRCCLSEGCYKDISTEYFWMGKREVYAEMLLDTYNLKIAYSKSGGPNSNSRLICEPCISRLRDATDFKRQVEECEKTFMQYLDPATTSNAVLDVTSASQIDFEVKVEQVKMEKPLSDTEDFDDRPDFGDDDDDDDDLDDQPLMNLATKGPKKESIQLMDLLDNAKAGDKRKSTTKPKSSPAKKTKSVIKLKKDTAKPSSSKSSKTEKKKKALDTLIQARLNAKIIMTYSTAYPFRVPINDMMCVYCGDSFEDPGVYRRHMRDDHSKFNIQTGVSHVHNNCNEFIKVDCTELMCRICDMEFKSIDSIAEHLVEKHDKKMVLSAGLGLQVFNLGEELWTCAFCGSKFPCLRALSRHTSVHYHRYTCETCGRSYMNKENLQRHVIFGHSKEKVCMRCRKLFPNCEARRKHVLESPKCWHYLCGYCGQRFINTQLKTQHLIEVHKEERKTHTCPNCGEIFQKWNLYRTHFVTVHTSNYYACPYCELKFDTKRRLNEHKVLHTQEKNYVCPVCSKTFARKKSLAQHSWLHKEEKRFECIPCNKKFNQKVSWRTHMKSYHPGEYHG